MLYEVITDEAFVCEVSASQVEAMSSLTYGHSGSGEVVDTGKEVFDANTLSLNDGGAEPDVRILL